MYRDDIAILLFKFRIRRRRSKNKKRAGGGKKRSAALKRVSIDLSSGSFSAKISLRLENTAVLYLGVINFTSSRKIKTTSALRNAAGILIRGGSRAYSTLSYVSGIDPDRSLAALPLAGRNRTRGKSS